MRSISLPIPALVNTPEEVSQQNTYPIVKQRAFKKFNCYEENVYEKEVDLDADVVCHGRTACRLRWSPGTRRPVW
jgi:hypothetical protein